MSAKIKKRNLSLFFSGYFFIILSGIMLSYFLPFYLREQGLSILEIGAFLTLGIALGSLIGSFIFGKWLKKIKLRTGLSLSAGLAFFYSFFFYIFPNFTGVIISEFTGRVRTIISRTSSDVTVQHNISKNGHRKASSYLLILDSIAVVLGLILSILLIKVIGFRNSLLFFALIAIPGFYFYSKIDDETRFKTNRIKKIKINKTIKLLAIAENAYWFALASSFVLVITFLLTDYFSSSIIWIAILFGSLNSTIVVSTLLTRKFLDRLNYLKSSIFGVILLLISAIAVILSTNVYFLIAAMVLEGIGAGIWVPSKTAYLWKKIPKSQREEATAFVNGWRIFFNALGPFFGGFLVTSLGILAPFYFKAIVCLIPISIYIYLLKLKN